MNWKSVTCQSNLKTHYKSIKIQHFIVAYSSEKITGSILQF